jgi:dihydroorotate dehydrogenase electron transfer subunit
VRADHRAVLLHRRVFSPGFFSVTFRASALAREVSPGQFVMLEVAGRLRPYLRRAYSVADADPDAGEVEFLVRTIGPGTAALEDLAEGSAASLLGPLGNGFSLDGLGSRARVAVVAGGIGAAPFPLLFRALASAGIVADLYLGGRNAAELDFRSRFDGIVRGETVLSTDDGSLGEKGFVTDAFARRAAASGPGYARVFACGPMPMFAALARVVERFGVPSEFSTEAAMGCGFGACLGCVIPATEKPFVISCLEGPILAPQKIAWEKI